MIKPAFWVLVLSTAAALHADLAAIKAEPNLEKRARLALTNAGDVLTTAQNDYEKGDRKDAEALFRELRELVEVAQAALVETRKNPVRSPKQFKNAEVRTRELLRRLDGFEQGMDFADRGIVAPVKARIQEIHDEWLLGIMGPKK